MFLAVELHYSVSSEKVIIQHNIEVHKKRVLVQSYV